MIMASTPKNILSFAREAGGAAAIGPVCREMKRLGWNLWLLAKSPGLDVFKRQELDPEEYSGFHGPSLDRLVRERWGTMPDAVFTSAASLPVLDMTERYLWQWARERKIPSLALLDQWQNYALRFSGPEPGQELKWLPDRILVMDETARREMIAEGLPDDRIVITGQPAFDEIRRSQTERESRVEEFRQRVGLPEGGRTVVFAAERLKEHFGEKLGYDEDTTLRFLGDVLHSAMVLGPSRPSLLVKLHPQNGPEDFAWCRNEWSGLKIRFCASELTALETIAAADLVVGMSSVMLLESILCGKPTVSLELNAKVAPQLVAVKAGAVPHLTRPNEAREVIRKLLEDREFGKFHLERQKGWIVPYGASEKCVDTINRFIVSEKNKNGF